MKYYKNAVLGWVVIYVFIALLGNKLSSNGEFFPFFRWSLYSVVPNKTELPFVLVNKIGDSTLTTPVNLIDLRYLTNQSVIVTNKNVSSFYKKVKKSKEEVDINTFQSLLPNNSEFILYVKTLDLTGIEYKKEATIKKVLEFKNNTINVVE